MNMDTCPKCGKENCQCGETCECEPIVDENKYTEDDAT
mgnify:CR=1 FL=1